MRNFFSLSVMLLALFFANRSSSQDLPEVIPPSPNAASLGTYGQIPIGKFTGTAQVSVPIHTFGSNNLSIPISVNYGSNGIRVDQLASHVGLGWSLNAGGVITRSLRDDADEDATRLMVPDFPLESQEMRNFLSAAYDGSGAADTQPDLFSFNFNGYSGTFYLDELSNPTLLRPSPLKIIHLNNVSDSEPDFKIIDPKGVVYFFGGGNATEEGYNQSYNCGAHSPPSNMVDTAWYLTKVVHPYGDEINLVYESYNNTYDSGISQTITNSIENCSGAGGEGVSSSESTCVSRVYSKVALLIGINSTVSGRVEFAYSIGIPGSQGKKLDVMTIYDANDSLMKSYDLEYEVIDSDLTYLNPNVDITTKAEDRKRLFLREIIEKGNDGVANPAHTFDYINPEQFPPRLSFAQDYWGYFNGASSNTHIVNDLSNTHHFDNNNIVSNRNPNEAYGKKGMLQKVTFPTGGTHEIFYESHIRYGIENVNTSTTESITVESGEDFGTHVQTFTLDDAITEDVTIYTSARLENCQEYPDPNNYPFDVQGVLQVLDVTDPANAIALGFWTNPNFPPTTTSWTVADINTPGIVHPYVKLIAGHDYEFRISVNRPCLSAGLTFSHISSQVTNNNVKTGGVRVSKTHTNDLNGNVQIKKYHYASLSNLNMTSGIGEKPRPQYYYSYDLGVAGCPGQVDRYSISSNTLHPLYSMQGYHVGYESVIESFGENFEKGGIETKYHIVLPPLPLIIGTNDNNNEIPGTSYTNIFGIGREKEQIVFRKDGTQYITLSTKENIYTHDNTLDKSMKVYDVRKKCSTGGTPCGVLSDPNYYKSFDINQSNIKTQWHYLSQSEEKQYDLNGLNPVVTTTNYFYENPDHLQVTRTEVLNSEGKVMKTKSYYPDDVTSNTSLGNDILTPSEHTAINLLKSSTANNPNGQHRIGEVIQTETIVQDVNGMGVSKNTQRTNYKTENGLVLPKSIQTLKGDYSINNNLEDRIQFISYYANGNVKEVSKSNGVVIVYVWGYNQTQPIAKIENATYAEVQGYVSNLQTLSDLDNDRTVGNVGSEGALRAALENLRNGLPNARISTYTYDPLVGVTSMTDPRGQTMYYEYDALNRLEHVKDKDGNILSKNQYNYATQN